MRYPLSHYSVMDTSDPDECVQVVSGHLGSHAYSRETRQNEFRASLNRAGLSDSTIVFLNYGSGVDIRSAYVESSFLVMAPLSGSVAVSYDGERSILQPGAGLIVAPEQRFDAVSAQPCASLLWKLPYSSLKRSVFELFGRDVQGSIRFRPELDGRNGKGASLLRSLRFVADELDQVDGAASCNHVTESLEQFLIRTLLGAQPNSVMDNPAGGSAGIVPGCVRRVEAYIAAKLDQPLTSSELARAAGVSARTMYSAFHQFRGIPPMAYLRNARLKKARELLTAAANSSSVSTILADCGVSQFGRFAVEYRKMYGETPSQTLRRC